jgi:hypothetical protein
VPTDPHVPRRILVTGVGANPGFGLTRRVLREAVDVLHERYPGLHVAAEHVRKQPGPALLAEAEKAELLVIGSRGTSGVGGFISGSVAMATVAHVDRPVVLVRAGRTAADEHLPDASGKASTDTPLP